MILAPARASAPQTDNAPVAQLDRVLGYEPSGREFESLRARQKLKGPFMGPFCFCLPVEFELGSPQGCVRQTGTAGLDAEGAPKG